MHVSEKPSLVLELLIILILTPIILVALPFCDVDPEESWGR